MKFLHLSDLHLGIRLHEVSLMEDQRYMLDRIADVCNEEKVDAVLISGDVYDKPVPPAEAIQLFDAFLTKLSDMNIKVMVSSGNHDSAERLAFGSSIMSSKGVHFSPVYNGSLQKVTVDNCDIWMLPFVKPANVRRYFEQQEINDYTDGVRVALSNVNLDKTKTNILMCHQFVTDSSSGDSVVGGLDNVDCSVFNAFDYVALGHIHESYSIGRPNVRYCGTVICYDFRFCEIKRGIDVVSVDGSDISVKTLPFKPLHEMINMRGSMEELIDKAYANETLKDAYVHITLTDEEEIMDAVGRMRALYPNMLCLDYDNARTRAQGFVSNGGEMAEKDPFELFCEFYELRNGAQMSDVQQSEVRAIINDVWGGAQ